MDSNAIRRFNTFHFLSRAALVAIASIVMIGAARFTFGQQVGQEPQPKPVCPDTGATSTASSQTTGATTTCGDGSACGFTVTITHTNWTCAPLEGSKCVADGAAPQVQVVKYDCTGTAPYTMCTPSAPTNVSTTTGKKTKPC